MSELCYVNLTKAQNEKLRELTKANKVKELLHFLQGLSGSYQDTLFQLITGEGLYYIGFHTYDNELICFGTKENDDVVAIWTLSSVFADSKTIKINSFLPSQRQNDVENVKK